MILSSEGRIRNCVSCPKGVKMLFYCHTTQNTGHGGGGMNQGGICKKVSERATESSSRFC